MFTPEQLAKYHRLRKQSQGATRHRELTEVVDAFAADHPIERKLRARQAAQAINTSRLPGTFGDD